MTILSHESTICIHRDVIGHSMHLLAHAGGSYSLCSEIPSDAWCYAAEMKELDSACLDTLLALSSRETVKSEPEEKFARPFRELRSHVRGTPWAAVMPSRAYERFIVTLAETLRTLLMRTPLDYWHSAWTRAGDFLRTLETFTVDREALEFILTLDYGNVPAVKSFLNGRETCGPVVYNRLSTVTGRYSVKKGPHVLTLNKELREFVFKSSYPEGAVWCIDMRTFEPRVAAFESGTRLDPRIDIYNEIASLASVRRERAKEAVMQCMYGDGSGVVKLDESVRKFIDVDSLRQRLASDYVLGEFKNSYGRPLFTADGASVNLLVSHFVQSTAVDASVLSFAHLSNRLREMRVRPLFLVHDALFVDVPSESVQRFTEVSDAYVEKYQAWFPVSLSRVTRVQ